MQSGIYIGLSAQATLKKRLDTVAHNIANVNTAGFRAEQVRFEALVTQAGDKDLAFSSSGNTYLARGNGKVSQTSGPLDFAVSGEGWLAFQGRDGTVYTRDGRMRISTGGVLQTLDGQSVLDASGTPISIDASAGPPMVARDGMITQAGRQVGAIGLFSISKDAELTRHGGSGVVSSEPAKPVLDFNANGILQGYVEGANVDPVREMTQLISLQRTFESVNSSMSASEQSMTDAIKTLGGSA